MWSRLEIVRSRQYNRTISASARDRHLVERGERHRRRATLHDVKPEDLDRRSTVFPWLTAWPVFPGSSTEALK
jgi:hypothetical protein